MSQRWVTLLEATIDSEVLQEGLHYARLGQVVSMHLNPGCVEAVVQGRARTPHPVRLELDTPDPKQWEQLIDAMASEAVYGAKLHSGEVPRALEQLFAALDQELIPTNPGSLRTGCTCPARRPCKHAACVGYLLAERLDTDPLSIFALRGMPADRVLERLQEARAALGGPRAAAGHVDPMIRQSQMLSPSLEESLEEFWGSPARLAKLRDVPPAEHAPHALLRRLGPPPLGGRFPLVGLLASVYDTVSGAAIRIRDEAERID